MIQIKNNIKADAVLWDFDGTLANSAAKNIAITRKILAKVAPRLTGDKLPACLQNEAEYHAANHGADHWRDLYRDFFGMNTAEIEIAGPLWEPYQLRDRTSVSLFDGVTETVRHLSRLPQGICSANATQNITQVLDEHKVRECFQSVVGYEELEEHEQKPAPDGGLRCVNEIFGQSPEQLLHKTIIYIGDHIADVIFARGLGARLHPSNTVISVVTTHSGARPQQWREQPDEVVDSPPDLLSLLGD